jgi:hypothetical protein
MIYKIKLITTINKICYYLLSYFKICCIFYLGPSEFSHVVIIYVMN